MVAREVTDIHTVRLAQAAGRGDRAALAAFVRATQDDIWRFHAHVSGADCAGHLAQETYLQALSRLPGFTGRSSARAWLLGIARQVGIDHLHRRTAPPRISARVDWSAVADRAEEKDRPSGHDDFVELNLLLGALPPEQREALVLTQVIGMSYAQAASVMGCQVSTVRSRVAAAREELIAAHGGGAMG
ncbi:MAG: sigma-70 family RNA polymerase sigma factor [Mycobacterium sp.]|uniref:sigma-70 family RNA polymerase sigma factor n=1 Tax=Mycobacterium sp. TaxID=1785 RepID=UPI00260D1096|nr:sigma-70 family RNA polymerase sigma factor [Mycobacterium sp.]MDI3313545.1 sigma-70 family RNA polymerase sigma factor [Mycobacterium sp.]